MKVNKYYCDRCNKEIKEYNKPKKTFFIFTRKDYVIEFGLTYIPKQKVEQKLDFCNECFNSLMKWYNKD